MPENNNHENSNFTRYIFEKAMEVFSLDETIEIILKDFPVRNSYDELMKAIERKVENNNEDTIDELKAKVINMLGVSQATVDNWKKGQADFSRDVAIKITFALQMSVDDANAFLTVSCGYNSFYMRDYKDFIYAFCLGNKDMGLDYACAKNIIDKHSALERPNPKPRIDEQQLGTPITQWLNVEQDKLSTVDELDDFLERHEDYFGSFRRRAHENFTAMYKYLKRGDLELDDERTFEYTDSEICKQILMEIDVNAYEGANTITDKVLKKIAERMLTANLDSFRVDMVKIMGQTPKGKGKNFIPQVNRKHLILIWMVMYGGKPNYADSPDDGEVDYEESKGYFEESMKKINGVLEKCGMPRLDPRTPFDWVMLNALAFCNLKRDTDDDAVDRINKVINALFKMGRDLD